MAIALILVIVWAAKPKPEWKSLFNGKNLDGWTVRGKAKWKVIDGVLTGEGENGHIYAAPELTDLEVKGTFRITSTGKDANSGLYFRANPPDDNPDGYPRIHPMVSSNRALAYISSLRIVTGLFSFVFL